MSRNIVRCKNGHSYNANEYQRCPHCGEAGGDIWNQADDMPRKGKVMEDSTVAYTDFYENGSGTVPDSGIQYKNAPGRGRGYSEDETRPETHDIKWKTSGSTKTETEDSDLKEIAKDLKRENRDPKDREDDATHAYAVTTAKNDPVVGWLVCVSGDDSGIGFPLKTGKNFIGRSVEMDVALKKDKSISRDRHAIIIYEPTEKNFFVLPGESHGLSYLNGKVVMTPNEIAAYDRLKIGATELVFVPFCGPNFSWDELKKND